MNCKQISASLADFLYDEIDRTVKLEIENHLEDCESCRAEVESLSATIAALDRWTVELSPVDFGANAPVESGRAGRVALAQRRWIPLLFGAAAAWALTALLVLAFGRIERTDGRFAVLFAVSDRAEIAPPPNASAQKEYLLLLRSRPPQRPTGIGEPTRVAEYSAWARNLANRGQLVGGEKLADDTARVIRLVDNRLNVNDRARPQLTDPVGGYFRVRAKDYASAVQIAATCPHVAHYGETIELRRIETAPETVRENKHEKE